MADSENLTTEQILRESGLNAEALSKLPASQAREVSNAALDKFTDMVADAAKATNEVADNVNKLTIKEANKISEQMNNKLTILSNPEKMKELSAIAKNSDKSESELIEMSPEELEKLKEQAITAVKAEIAEAKVQYLKAHPEQRENLEELLSKIDGTADTQQTGEKIVAKQEEFEPFKMNPIDKDNGLESEVMLREDMNTTFSAQNKPSNLLTEEAKAQLAAEQEVVEQAKQTSSVEPVIEDDKAVKPTAKESTKTHTVKSGDTFWSVAKASLGKGASNATINAKMDELLVENNFTRETAQKNLQIGATIVDIPNGESIAAATATGQEKSTEITGPN